MNLWRVEGPERPKVLSGPRLMQALALHLVAFVFFYAYSVVHSWFNPPPEKVIPIDLTVVVVENLEGDENEPPPLKKPEPPPPPPKVEPPKPKPKPKVKEPEKPKELEKIVTNIVAKVDKKEEKKEPEKPKKPEPPKKTAKELREERIKRMRDSAKDTKKKPSTKPAPPQPNGRTARKTLSDAEIQRLLNMGYKPGKSEQIADNELQRCYSLIKNALESKWDAPAWNDRLRPMQLECRFGPGGRLITYRLVQKSGDAAADRSILDAAGRVNVVRGLTPAFIEKFRSGIIVEFTVTGR